MRIERIYPLLTVMLITCTSVGWGQENPESGNRNERMVHDWTDQSSAGNWVIVNDGVMGGISRSEFFTADSATAVFQGIVSLENNGGFASVRTRSTEYSLDGYAGLMLRVRGDGKTYQLRVRTDNRFDGISYRYRFETEPGQWITIQAPFREFVPVFRGRILNDVDPISPGRVQQIGFLIADKQVGRFQLKIKWIRAFSDL
jgi:monofunctional biosynthetic peptidoglycan transglycosylase